ncbi:hypothetical protein K0M31_004035 [Melipona bicolor]|uniref:Uncharacterized protein n=1 Tax=Melipona bicolor TaxID=60889 RepID=A0AA40KP63_9HYME|nr:hypothetical protein K0M31_004035 [Melipona bicolor]
MLVIVESKRFTEFRLDWTVDGTLFIHSRRSSFAKHWVHSLETTPVTGVVRIIYSFSHPSPPFRRIHNYRPRPANPLLLRQAYPIFLTNLPDVLARLCLKKGARRDFVNEKLISTKPNQV